MVGAVEYCDTDIDNGMTGQSTFVQRFEDALFDRGYELRCFGI